MVISCEAGYLKYEKEGRQFIDIAEKLNINLSETVLIDDSDKTLDVFKRLGGTAIKTTSFNKTLEILENLTTKKTIPKIL